MNRASSRKLRIAQKTKKRITKKIRARNFDVESISN